MNTKKSYIKKSIICFILAFAQLPFIITNPLGSFTTFNYIAFGLCLTAGIIFINDAHHIKE